MSASSPWHWLAVVFAALLAVGGLVVVGFALFRDRPRGRPRCPRCWYEMAGVAGLKCPECGREVRHAKKLLKTRRRWRRAAAGVAMVVLAAATAIGEPMIRQGVVVGMPTWAYIGALPWLESGAGMKELRRRVDSGEIVQWEYGWLVQSCIRSLRRAEESQKKIDLAEALGQIEWHGRMSIDTYPFGSWAPISEIDNYGTISALVTLLNDPDPAVRIAGAANICLLGDRGANAIPVLLAHLESDDQTLVQVINYGMSLIDIGARGRLCWPGRKVVDLTSTSVPSTAAIETYKGLALAGPTHSLQSQY